MPEVTMIPASIARISAKASAGVQCRRVAAYARVSTDSEEQLTSYEAQVDHYTKYIQSREDWIFVGIYTDDERLGAEHRSCHHGRGKRRRVYQRML